MRNCFFSKYEISSMAIKLTVFKIGGYLNEDVHNIFVCCTKTRILLKSVVPEREMQEIARSYMRLRKESNTHIQTFKE